jgi:hypothetical protein
MESIDIKKYNTGWAIGKGFFWGWYRFRGNPGGKRDIP